MSLELHRRFLRRFVRPGSRVLEVGAGPGRFTLDLATLGCQIVVTGVTALSEVVGEEANDQALRTGDLRHVVDDPGGHICQMFRWSEVEALVERTGRRMLDGSASNWASRGDAEALSRLEADAGSWRPNRRAQGGRRRAAGRPGRRHAHPVRCG